MRAREEAFRHAVYASRRSNLSHPVASEVPALGIESDELPTAQLADSRCVAILRCEDLRESSSEDTGTRR